MKRRWLLALLAALPFITSAAQVDVYKRGPRGSGGGAGGEDIVTVCPSGCDATVVCGASLTVSTNSTCVAGSAVEVARALTPSITNPVTIEVVEGVYTSEAVAINNMTDWTLVIGPNVVLRPTVTVAASVNGGTVRIANDATVGGVDRAKIINYGEIWNDAYSSPEAAVQIGREACTDDVPTYRAVEFVNFGLVVGHHDGVQWCGLASADATNATNLPRAIFRNYGRVVSGRDAIAKKGNGRDLTLPMGDVLVWPDYCEAPETALLDVVTGPVGVAGGGDGFTLTSDNPGVDDYYVGRVVTVTDDGGADCGAANVCDGFQAIIRNYVTSTNTLDWTTSISDSCVVTTGCNYSIAAVPRHAEAPCRAVDWTVIAGNSGSYQWKQTVLHQGAAGADIASPLDEWIVGDGIGRIMATSGVLFTNAACSSQGSITGALLGYTAATNWGKTLLERVSFDIEILAAQQDPGFTTPPLCTTPINGVALMGDSDVMEAIYRNGSVRIRNTADLEINMNAFNATTSNADTLRLEGAVSADIDPPGSYTGTSATIAAASPAVLSVAGTLTSPDLITISDPDQITGWVEHCETVLNGAGVAFDVHPFPVSDGLTGVRPQMGACRCQGTCALAETAVLADPAGNTIATLTCQDNSTALTFADVTGDADHDDFVANQSPLIVSGTLSGVATDDLEVCLRVTGHTWNP